MGDSPLLARLRRLLRETSANAAIEYALILAVITTVVILAAKSLAPSLFVGAMADGTDFRQQATAQAQKATLAAEELTVAAAQPEPARPTPWFELALVGASMLAGGAYYVERLRKRQKQQQAEEEEEEKRFRCETQLDPVQQPRFIAKRQQILRFVTRRHDETNTRMRVGDVMTAKLTVVPPDTKIEEIHRLVDEKHLRHILVVNSDGSIAGIISDRDLKLRGGRRASDLMTADPLCVPEDMVVSEAIRLMVCHGISCLPITQDGFPMGLLTTTDLLLTFQCAQQMLKQVAAAAPDPNRSLSDGLAQLSNDELQANLQA